MEASRLIIYGEFREHECYHLLFSVCFQVLFCQFSVKRVLCGSVLSRDVSFVVFSLCMSVFEF